MHKPTVLGSKKIECPSPTLLPSPLLPDLYTGRQRESGEARSALHSSLTSTHSMGLALQPKLIYWLQVKGVELM